MFRRKRTAALLFGIDATPVFAKITLLKPGAASRPGAQTLAYLSNNSRRTHFNVVHRLEGQTSVKTKSNVYCATTKPLPAPTHFPSTLKWGRDLIAKVYTAPLSPRPPLPRRCNVTFANTGVAVSAKRARCESPYASGTGTVAFLLTSFSFVLVRNPSWLPNETWGEVQCRPCRTFCPALGVPGPDRKFRQGWQ